MRSCRRELATKGNLDGAVGGISYSLLCLVPGGLVATFQKYMEVLLKYFNNFIQLILEIP